MFGSTYLNQKLIIKDIEKTGLNVQSKILNKWFKMWTMVKKKEKLSFGFLTPGFFIPCHLSDSK